MVDGGRNGEGAEGVDCGAEVGRHDDVLFVCLLGSGGEDSIYIPSVI